MKKIIVILSVFIFLGIIPQAFCADVAKIGIFNFQKILTDSSAGKMIQKEINEKGNELQKKLKAENQILRYLLIAKPPAKKILEKRKREPEFKKVTSLKEKKVELKEIEKKLDEILGE